MSERWFFEKLGSPWSGMRLGDWLRLSRHAEGRVSNEHRARGVFISLGAAATSCLEAERRVDFDRPADPPGVGPVFVLGHWRSGTTFLQEVLACSPSLATPTMGECLFPWAIGRTSMMRLGMRAVMPPDRGVDAVPFGVDRPFEDEFALAILTGGLSPYLAWSFPRRRAEFERFLSLRDASAAELARWKGAIRWFVARLSERRRKPLVLKSPTHTARLALLMELFPRAVFLHVHRHPVAVFRSTRRLYDHATSTLALQTTRRERRDEEILGRYERLYGSFLENRRSVPADRLMELGFEDLRERPDVSLRAIGRFLADHGIAWDATRPLEAARRPWKTRSSDSCSTRLARLLSERWSFAYPRWGYEIPAAPTPGPTIAAVTGSG